MGDEKRVDDPLGRRARGRWAPARRRLAAHADRGRRPSTSGSATYPYVRWPDVHALGHEELAELADHVVPGHAENLLPSEVHQHHSALDIDEDDRRLAQSSNTASSCARPGRTVDRQPPRSRAPADCPEIPIALTGRSRRRCRGQQTRWKRQDLSTRDALGETCRPTTSLIRQRQAILHAVILGVARNSRPQGSCRTIGTPRQARTP